MMRNPNWDGQRAAQQLTCQARYAKVIPTILQLTPVSPQVAAR